MELVLWEKGLSPSLEKEKGNLLHLYPTPLVHYEDIFLRPEISLVSIISKKNRPVESILLAEIELKRFYLIEKSI